MKPSRGCPDGQRHCAAKPLGRTNRDAYLMCKDCQPTDTTIDVRTIAPPLRHSLIFRTFENLGGGESFLLVNDHDPRPLYHQFSAHYPGIFDWSYEQSGPELWQVRIARLVA